MMLLTAAMKAAAHWATYARNNMNWYAAATPSDKHRRSRYGPNSRPYVIVHTNITHTHIHIQVHTHRCTYTYTHTYAHTNIHTRAHTYTYTYAHTHTHTHTPKHRNTHTPRMLIRTFLLYSDKCTADINRYYEI